MIQWHDIEFEALNHAAKSRRDPAAYIHAVKKAGAKYGPIRHVRGKYYIRIHQTDYVKIALEHNPNAKELFNGVTFSGGLGDLVHKAAGPIGKAIRWPCLKGDGTTDLKPGSPCDRARKKLNQVGNKIGSIINS